MAHECETRGTLKTSLYDGNPERQWIMFSTCRSIKDQKETINSTNDYSKPVKYIVSLSCFLVLLDMSYVNCKPESGCPFSKKIVLRAHCSYKMYINLFVRGHQT